MKASYLVGIVLRSVIAAGIGLGIGHYYRKHWGAGVGATPVRRDAGAPGVAVLDANGRKPTEAGHSSGLPGFALNETPPPQQHSDQKPHDEPKVLYVRGYVVKRDKINVVLSDGRVFTELDKELGPVARNSAMVDGKKLFMLEQGKAVAPAPTPEPQKPVKG